MKNFKLTDKTTEFISKFRVMLKELILTYIRLQVESLKDETQVFRVKTDYMRASLRNKIATIIDMEDIELQSEIESIAFDIYKEKINITEAIKNLNL